PKGLASAVEELVRLPSRVSLPALQDGAQRFVWYRPEHSMNVVWHDHPGIKPIALFLEEAYCACNDISDLRSPQPAGAVAGVQEPFNSAAEVPLDFLQIFGDFDGLPQFLRGFLLRIEAMQPFCLL